LSRVLDKTMDHFDELIRFVFLKEMAGTADRDVSLAGSAGNELVEDPLAAFHDGVLVAEGSEEWSLERLENVPCSLIFRDRRMFGCDGNECRESPRPSL